MPGIRKDSDSAVIKLGRYLLEQVEAGQDEFPVEELMNASGNTQKGAFFKTLQGGYPFLFRRAKDTIITDMSIFEGQKEVASREAFLKELREELSILEKQTLESSGSSGRGVDRR